MATETLLIQWAKQRDHLTSEVGTFARQILAYDGYLPQRLNGYMDVYTTTGRMDSRVTAFDPIWKDFKNYIYSMPGYIKKGKMRLWRVLDENEARVFIDHWNDFVFEWNRRELDRSQSIPHFDQPWVKIDTCLSFRPSFPILRIRPSRMWHTIRLHGRYQHSDKRGLRTPVELEKVEGVYYWPNIGV